MKELQIKPKQNTVIQILNELLLIFEEIGNLFIRIAEFIRDLIRLLK